MVMTTGETLGAASVVLTESRSQTQQAAQGCKCLTAAWPPKLKPWRSGVRQTARRSQDLGQLPVGIADRAPILY